MLWPWHDLQVGLVADLGLRVDLAVVPAGVGQGHGTDLEKGGKFEWLTEKKKSTVSKTKSPFEKFRLLLQL